MRRAVEVRGAGRRPARTPRRAPGSAGSAPSCAADRRSRSPRGRRRARGSRPGRGPARAPLTSQYGCATTAAPPAAWIRSTASSALGQRRATNAFAPGTRYSSKNGPRSGPAPAARAMCGRPMESAAPACATASSKVTSTPCSLRRSMISRARLTRSCWARSHAGAICVEVDPVAEHVEVIGVLVHAGHLHGRHALDAGLLRGRDGVGNTRDGVVVGQRHHCHAGLRRRGRDLSRGQLAIRYRRVSL